MIKHAVFIVTALLGASSSFAAALIFNTGVDAAGAVVANGTPEAHYYGTGGTPTVDATISPAPAPDAASAWIYPNELGPGSYALETDFITDAAQQVTITGRWAAMSEGFFINFNGTYLNEAIAGGDTSWHDFSITGTTFDYGAIGAKNYLVFDVYHSAPGAPLGLRVEIASVAAVPEPGALIAVVPAAGLALARRRRR